MNRKNKIYVPWLYQTVRGLLFAVLFLISGSRTVQAAQETEPAVVTLKIEQVFLQPSSAVGKDIGSYQLTALDTGAPMPAGSSAGVYLFTIAGNGKAEIGPLVYDHGGVFNYEIRQVITGEETGYTYDRRIYTVQVLIKNSGYGLSSELIVENELGEKVSDLVYQNAYCPLPAPPDLMADPPVCKTVAGNPSRDGIFTFKLAAQEHQAPMPAGSKDGVKLITIRGSGTKDFGTWEYQKAGTYRYTISEVNTGSRDYLYDTMIYTITDQVTDVDGRLVLKRVVVNADQKQVQTLDFKNTYRPVGSSYTGSIWGPKTGDESLLAVYQRMMLISGMIGCGVMLILFGRKRKRDDEDSSISMDKMVD